MCKTDQIANMLLASENWGPGHAQPFFLLAQLRQESKLKIKKWSDFEGFLIFRSEGKFNKIIRFLYLVFSVQPKKHL